MEFLFNLFSSLLKDLLIATQLNNHLFLKNQQNKDANDGGGYVDNLREPRKAESVA
jgi:hypothetical protein